MVRQRIVVKSEKGIHLRIAEMLCEEAIKYKSHIEFTCKNKTVNGKSILGLLAAGIKCNDSIEIICTGVDENQALEQLLLLFQNGFGEKQVDRKKV
ncbi:MAG: HPr family phosphocarrier protein [Velocimicrobium sp.]